MTKQKRFALASILPLVLLVVFALSSQDAAMQSADGPATEPGQPVPGADVNTPTPHGLSDAEYRWRYGDSSHLDRVPSAFVVQGAGSGQGYPPPPEATLTPPSPGVYEDMDPMAVAQIVLQDWVSNNRTVGPTTVVTATYVYAPDAPNLEVPERMLTYGGEPDVALILGGTLLPHHLPRMSGSYSYARIVVDLATGTQYSVNVTDDLQALLDTLP